MPVSVTDSGLQKGLVKVTISAQKGTWPHEQTTAGCTAWRSLTLRWPLVLRVDGGGPEAGVTLLVSWRPLYFFRTGLAAVPVGMGQGNDNVLVSKQVAPTQNA